MLEIIICGRCIFKLTCEANANGTCNIAFTEDDEMDIVYTIIKRKTHILTAVYIKFRSDWSIRYGGVKVHTDVYSHICYNHYSQNIL